MSAQTSPELISFRTLRKWIGYLGILLPFICWLSNTVINRLDLLNNPYFVNKDFSQIYIPGADLKSSVSHFYYTAAGPLFIGILITVSIFLFTYKGYPSDRKEDKYPWLTDRRISAFSAVCALGIVVFPTGSHQAITDNIHIFVSSDQAGTLHLIFATLFFTAMALMCLINFRRNPGKVLINDAEGRLYLICGWGIIACIVFLALQSVIRGGEQWLWTKAVFIAEVFMLLFFGIAWLVKGKSLPMEFVLKKVAS